MKAFLAAILGFLLTVLPVAAAEEQCVQVPAPQHVCDGAWRGRQIDLPSSIPRPIRITRVSMINQASEASAGTNGLWFLAVDPAARFSKWSRWPSTESGPLGRFIPIVFMPLQNGQPNMVMQTGLNVIYRDGDRIITDSSCSSTSGTYAVWQIARICYVVPEVGEVPALPPGGDLSACTSGINADTVLNVNFENAWNAQNAADTSDYFKPTIRALASVDPATPHAYIDGTAFLDVDGVISGDTSMRFDGASMVRFQENAHFNVGASNWVVEIKVRPEDTSTTQALIHFSAGQFAPISIVQVGSSYKFFSSYDGTAQNAVNGADIGTASVGVAAKLRAVRSGTTISLYKDDVLISTATVSGALMDNGGSLVLGKKLGSFPVPFTGVLDDVYMRKTSSFMSAGSTPIGQPYCKG